MTAENLIADAQTESVDWHVLDATEVTARLDVDPDQGLRAAEFARRQGVYGPNELPAETPPSLWQVARGQLSNPMNIMLIIVSIASLAIGQLSTGIFVALLVTFNVVMGSNQELKARAS